MKKEIFPPLSRASFTAEAALLMPMILFVMFAAVYLAAHVHNRTVLSARAHEQAVSGHEQSDPALFAAAGIRKTKTESDSLRTVIYRAETENYNRRHLWDISEEAVYEKVRPVRFIRRSLAAEKLLP